MVPISLFDKYENLEQTHKNHVKEANQEIKYLQQCLNRANDDISRITVNMQQLINENAQLRSNIYQGSKFGLELERTKNLLSIKTTELNKLKSQLIRIKLASTDNEVTKLKEIRYSNLG